MEATAADVQAAAQEWLSDGVFALEVHPFPDYQATATDVDRSDLPETEAPPKADFPDLQRATLRNGMEVVLVERHDVPLVDFTLLVDAGYAADQETAKPGTASLATNMLDEGTEDLDALEISDKEAMLGAEIDAGSELDVSSVSLSALKENLDASLDLYADVVLSPAFPQNELDRLKQQQIAAIQREKATPIQMALRVFPKLLYGERHAYGMPFTGSGTETSVQNITRDDLVAFHETWFKPNNATMVVVGDVTMDEVKPLLEARFSDWKKGNVPKKNIAEVEQPDGSVVYLMDRPGSQQSIIFAGHLAPPKSNPNEIAIETMNTILGGAFTSRINMNLREDKGWAYGAGSFMPGARGQRPFLAYAPVQSDKTAESMAEVAKELRSILNENPVTAEEVEKAQQNQTLALSGQWETIDAVGSTVAEIVRYGLADDYYDRYADAVNALDVENVSAAAEEVVQPDHLVWIVVGDRSEIESKVRDLGLGEIRVIDSEGNVVGTE